MESTARFTATDAIRQAKARYFRGVDTGDGELVRGMLAEDCVLDYRGCCTDPATGTDFMPAMNIVLRGAAAWSSEGFGRMGIVSVHHGHDLDLIFTSDTTADAIWSMTDRLFMPPGGPFAVMTGYGHYHETYVEADGRWLLKTLRMTRLRVETA